MTTLLTKREHELAVLIATRLDLGNKNYAYELTIAEKTVEKHRGTIYRKLKVRNCAELVVRLLRMGLIHIADIRLTHDNTNSPNNAGSSRPRPL